MVSKSVAMYFLMLSSRWFYNGFSRLLLCCDRLIVKSLFCGVALWYLLLACGSLVACLLLACCSLAAHLWLACCLLAAHLWRRYAAEGFLFLLLSAPFVGRVWTKKGRNLKRSRPLYFVVSSPKITRRDGLPQKDKHQRKCHTLCKHRD